MSACVHKKIVNLVLEYMYLFPVDHVFFFLAGSVGSWNERSSPSSLGGAGACSIQFRKLFLGSRLVMAGFTNSFDEIASPSEQRHRYHRCCQIVWKIRLEHISKISGEKDWKVPTCSNWEHGWNPCLLWPCANKSIDRLAQNHASFRQQALRRGISQLFWLWQLVAQCCHL